MELKSLIACIFSVNLISFNRTAYGIEMVLGMASALGLGGTFNRTAYGIEMYFLYFLALSSPLSFNRTAYGIEI